MSRERFQTYSIVCVGIFICALMVGYDFFNQDPIAVYSVKEFGDTAQKEQSPPQLDINLASLEQLIEIKGIGKVTAQRILNYREKHGKFNFIEELLEIEGIGPKKYEDIRKYLIVNP